MKQLLAAILLPVFLSSFALAQTPPRSGGAHGMSGKVEPAKPSPATDKLVPPVPPPLEVPTEVLIPPLPDTGTPVVYGRNDGIGVGTGTGIGPGLGIGPLRTSPKDGEAQTVAFDASNRPTLIFGNKSDNKKTCGLFASYTLMDNQEEAIALKVAHLHLGRLGVFGKPESLNEKGWLYMTPTRIVFRVEEGDKAHAFDLPRTALKDKPVSKLNTFKTTFIGIQINLKEKLAASDSSGQKFVFSLVSYSLVTGRGCYLTPYPKPYIEFIERAVEDFSGAVAELKQIADSLKQSGRFYQAPNNPKYGTGLGVPGNAGVDITSEPDGAEIYADGTFLSRTPTRMPLSVGKHAIRITKPGYKDWEQKIIVERGSVKEYKIVLEKQ